jgi:nucleoside-diphosphate-sugar epimerase
MSGNKTILLTGATGFLGSHIAEHLIANGYCVIAIKRASRNLSRCKDFNDKLIWINYERIQEEIESIRVKRPDILIHAAWNGVKSNDRIDWTEQAKNLNLLVDMLRLAQELSINKIIALGSQAEYGYFSEPIDETHQCKPYSAYGCFKNCASQILQCFSEENKMQWYWVRLFSVFGPREENNWLIPSVINNLLAQKEMNLTACQQEYDYLYVRDFTKSIQAIMEHKEENSGIYNLTTGHASKLENILQFLELKISPDQKLLNMGAIPYRANQVMKMVGNPTKFQTTFGFKPEFSMEEALCKTIDFYKSLQIKKNE